MPQPRTHVCSNGNYERGLSPLSLRAKRRNPVGEGDVAQALGLRPSQRKTRYA